MITIATTLAAATCLGSFKPKEYVYSQGLVLEQSLQHAKTEICHNISQPEPYTINSCCITSKKEPSINQEIQNILAGFSKLKDNWDGYGALPIDGKSIDNVRRVVAILQVVDLKKWQIAPGVNGDIYINYKGTDKLAGILVGASSFTYFIGDDNNLTGEENVPANPIVIAEIIRTIQG